MTYEMPAHIIVLPYRGRLVHNCGYGGGVGALKAMGAKMPEEEMQPLVDAWRAANPNIVAFWERAGPCGEGDHSQENLCPHRKGSTLLAG